jgi:hypothetical protein
MTRMRNHQLNHHHLVLGTLFLLLLPTPLQKHLQNMSLPNLPRLFTMDALMVSLLLTTHFISQN